MQITATRAHAAHRQPVVQRFLSNAVDRVLRIPLEAKLLGANTVIVVGTLAALLALSDSGAGTLSFTGAVVGGLLVAAVINVLLTHAALVPVREIEHTVARLSRGDAASRVPESRVADWELASIGLTLNALLDRLSRDREEMRALAKEVVRAGDTEDNRIARQLHESIAQSLAAVTYQLAAVAAQSSDGAVTSALADVRVLVGEILDEVDVLAHEVHPRVLHDLGLAAGLRDLARDVSRGGVPVAVRVHGPEDHLRELGHDIASALFRIALEAVQNALRHSGGSRVDIDVGTVNETLVLAIADNGRGFDPEEAVRRRRQKGLFSMRQRAELINAILAIDTSARGTSVHVTMPLGASGARDDEGRA